MVSWISREAIGVLTIPFVPFGSAVRYKYRMPTGKHRPIVCDCLVIEELGAFSKPDAEFDLSDVKQFIKAFLRELVDKLERDEFKTFVVKPVSSSALQVREVLGNLLARMIGLKTPRLAQIWLEKNLAEQINETDRSLGRVAVLHSGTYPATELLPLQPESMLLESPPERFLDDVRRLYVFDMLTGYADRVLKNPNCAMTHEGIVVFDFEDCFPAENRDFVPPDCPPWLASQYLAPVHMYHGRVGNAEEVGSVCQEVLGKIDIGELRKAATYMEDDANQVIAQLDEILTHREVFEDALLKSL